LGGGVNDITLIPRPIHAPSHELENTDTNTPPTKVIIKGNLVEFLGIREESVIIYLWGMNQLAYFILLFYIETCFLHLGVWCTAAFVA
jgi:hypothetical protein